MDTRLSSLALRGSIRSMRKRHDHVTTAVELRHRGVQGAGLQDRVSRGQLFELLPGVYCDRPPTSADKCRAVCLWREDAVLCMLTAAWIHGWCAEPDVIEAYVSSEPGHAVPLWLRLHVAPYESYAGDTMSA